MNNVVIQSEPYPHCSTSVHVSDVPGTDGTIILCIGTGAMSLQTYATRDELRELAEMLLRHANGGGVLGAHASTCSTSFSPAIASQA